MSIEDWTFFILGAFGGAGTMAIAFLHRVGPRPTRCTSRAVRTFKSDAVTTVFRGKFH